MALREGRIDWAEWRPTRHVGGRIRPTLGLFHDTAGRLKKYNTVNYLRKNSRKVAYHFVIEYDGTLVQLAPTDRRVNHAGRSSWKGQQWCNGYAIGIAFANPGSLKPIRKGGELVGARAWWHKANRGEKFSVEQGLELRDTPQHGKGHAWLKYSEAQMETARRLVEDLMAAYPKLDIAGHYHVSPKRKIDTNPLIDLKSFGTSEEADINAAVAEEPETADQALRKKSREYRTSNVGKFISGGGFTTAVAAFSLESVSATKSYLDLVKSFWADHGFLVFAGVCFGGYCLFEMIQHYKRQSYEDGNVTPSGELDDEAAGQENAAGGDWK
jgi:N-acetylmuramoyl-L-alanine amidase